MVGRKLKWSPQARSELRDIIAFYNRRNGSNAYGIKLGNLIDEKVRLYFMNPEWEQMQGLFQRRSFVCEKFQIFYRFTETEFEVTKVWDTRRNPKDLKLE